MPLIINTNYHGNFPAPAQAAFQRAVLTWQGILNSNIPVQVEAYWGVNIGNNLTAMCVPNGIENFANAPSPNTWYTSALADKLVNQDLQSDQADMAVFFDSVNFNWYTGQGNPQPNEYDLESVALHELCHGLGFLGLFWVDQNNQGSYGNNALLQVIPPNVMNLLPFQLPLNLNMHPSVYGRHIIDGNGNQLTNPIPYPNPSLNLGGALEGNQLFFNLNNYQVYAPNQFIPFTSIEHLNNQNSLMRPSINVGQVVRQVDAPVQNILQSLGW